MNILFRVDGGTSQVLGVLIASQAKFRGDLAPTKAGIAQCQNRFAVPTGNASLWATRTLVASMADRSASRSTKARCASDSLDARQASLDQFAACDFLWGIPAEKQLDDEHSVFLW